HDRFRGLPAIADSRPIYLAFHSARTRERRDDARLQVEPADTPVRHVRNEEAAASVEAAVVWLPKLRSRALATVSAVARLADAQDRRDEAGPPVHAADNRIQAINYVEVAVVRDGHGIRLVHGRFHGRAAVAGVAFLAASGHGRNNTGRGVDLPDAVIEGIR